MENPPLVDADANTTSAAAAMQRHLERAAELAAESGYGPETFRQAALSVYLSKNPALREQLETMQLAARLALLRSQGRVGLA